MAYGEYEQLKMLIKMLDYPNNDIYVHIDKKSPEIKLEELKNDIKYSKVYLYQEYPIYWGHFSQTQCEVFLLEKAIDNEYDYYHLISGADLPLCSQGKIHSYFDKLHGKEFVRYWGPKFPEQNKSWIKLYHPLQKYLRLSSHHSVNLMFEYAERVIEAVQLLFKVDRLKGCNYELQKGATWFSITHQFASYIVSKKKWICEYFKNTRSSDEVFIQTLLHNSDFKNNRFEQTYEIDGLTGTRYIDWKRGNPYTFIEEDFDELINCGFLFARKFSMSKDEKIVYRLFDYVTEMNRAECDTI